MTAPATSTKRRRMTLSKELKRFLQVLVFPMFGNIHVNRDEDQVLKAKLDVWFDAKNRDVILYKAVKPFKIIGPRWHSLSTPDKLMVEGDGRRDVKPGELVWVRLDARVPYMVEIEYDDQMFKVRDFEYKERYLRCLEEIC